MNVQLRQIDMDRRLCLPPGELFHPNTEGDFFMSFAITPPERPTLAIQGSDQLFPVRRVYCIGRNYAAHTVEMGGDPDRENPFFFQKNPDNLWQKDTFAYPPKSDDVHHEIEMLVALKSGGRNISLADANDCVFGYAAAIDMTRRDLQAEAKATRRPWEIGKAFEQSAPCGLLVPTDQCSDKAEGQVTLTVNGEVRQQGNLDQMIWKIPEMIAHLSDYYELAAGDVILSGTPSGVGPVQPGDVLTAEIDDLPGLTVTVLERI